MTADVGGATGGAGGVFGGFGVVPPDDDPPDEEPPDDEPEAVGPPEWNGSLLSKSENDCSWPVLAGGCTALTSCVEAELELAALGRAVAPASDGALGSAGVVAAGAGAGVVDDGVVSAATCGLSAADDPFRDIIVCTA